MESLRTNAVTPAAAGRSFTTSYSPGKRTARATSCPPTWKTFPWTDAGQESPRVPPVQPGETIWFGLAGSQPAERIEGILVDARKPFLRECSIRIKFLTPLPYATFTYLVYGPQHLDPKKVDRRECETDQFWR